MEITVKTAEQLRITPEEFELIKQKLGRTPNFTELCSFSAMWSEHCSYKNSIKWLKTLPRDGKKMLVKAGEENAGLMDIGIDVGGARKGFHAVALQNGTFVATLVHSDPAG